MYIFPRHYLFHGM